MSVYGGGGTYLETCNWGTCAGGYQVSTTTRATFDGLSGTWLIEGGTGCVKYGDNIFIKNMYHPGTYLDVCGSGSCGSGFPVSTTGSTGRDGRSGTWIVSGGSGCVNREDTVYLKSGSSGGAYLDVCGNATCGRGTTYAVSISASNRRAGYSGSWQFNVL